MIAMPRRLLVVAVAAATVLAVGAIVLVWHETEGKLAVSIETVAPPVSASACQALVRRNLGFNEDLRTCTKELQMPWVRASVRNVGHRGAPSIYCTATVFTGFGQAIVDLPTPGGGVPGTPVPAGHTISWVTFVPAPPYAPIQSWKAECRITTPGT